MIHSGFLFFVCYVAVVMVLFLIANRVTDFLRPMEKIKNNLPITIFALLSVVMVIVAVITFRLSVDKSIYCLSLGNFSFFFFAFFSVLQLLLSLGILIGHSAEVFHVFKYGTRQMFPGVFITAILSYILTTLPSL